MEQTLLLNASYEPLKIVHWQKAVTLWCQGKVEVISVYDREIRAVSFSFKLPSVIRLLRYIKIKRRFDYVPFSRANICARDDHRCQQYCGDDFPNQRAYLSIMSRRSPMAAGKTGETLSPAASTVTAGKAGAPRLKQGCICVVPKRRSRLQPSASPWIPERAGKLARLFYWNVELDDT